MIVNRRGNGRRGGIAILEFSLAFPILVTMLVGLILLGIGVLSISDGRVARA